MSLNAFNQRAATAGGYTSAIVASSAGSAPVQVNQGSQQGMWVANPTTLPVYIADGTSSIQASFPTTSTPGAGLCIPAGLAGPFTVDPHGYLSAATSAGTATIFATPGFGQ